MIPPGSEVVSPTAVISSCGPLSYHRDTTELELLHIWHEETYASFTPSESEQYYRINRAWQVDVVQEAFRFGFLLPAILSFASLHQSRLLQSPSEVTAARRYRILALQYQQEASQKFREGLTFVERDNHIAALTFSVLNMGMSLGTLSLELGDDKNCTRLTTCPILERIKMVFHMMQGLIQITEIAQPWLAGGPFQSPKYLMQGEQFCFPDDSTRTAFCSLIAYARNCDAMQQSGFDVKGCLERSVELLQRCFTTPMALCNSICLLWPSFVPRAFLRALENNEPSALLIVMYWGALLHKMEDKKWWINDAGNNVIREINQILSRTDEPRIANLKIWPLQQLLGAFEPQTIPTNMSQGTNGPREGLVATALCMI